MGGFGLMSAAVAAAVVLTKNDDKKDYYSDNTDCRLQILGNADENDYLDSNDVDKINEMIAEEKYSVWADANHDEKVDASDAEFVQKVLDLKKAIQRYVQLRQEREGGIQHISW